MADKTDKMEKTTKQEKIRVPSEKSKVPEALILAGIEELSKNGLQNFSVRRIANQCGVSCAAPYKHFKDKNDFIASIIDYVNFIWAKRQLEIVRQNKGDLRKQLLEISLDYIRFLVENPYFRSVLMLKDEEFDTKFANLKGQMSRRAMKLIEKFCKDAGMSDSVAQRKFYIVRSLIYGASLMFDNGEIVYNEENLQIFADTIDREFDLP